MIPVARDTVITLLCKLKALSYSFELNGAPSGFSEKLKVVAIRLLASSGQDYGNRCIPAIRYSIYII